MLELFEKNDIRVKRQHVLNKVTEYLVEKEMLPALCYVFSRKQLEKCASELTTNLLEFDSKVPYIIDRECEQIIRKLPNFEEYLHLPEYINTVKLLRKGVGIHHAGLIPIFREMTEMLFAKGYIKILFCTETMSVGINLPVKTTIFTDVNKFNGEIIRMLHSHEYTQAAGRAGRLGLDTVGHVVHLNNLFRNVETVNYKKMMDGKPQTLTSKFKISFQLLLNLLSIGDQNMEQFARKSMVTTDLDAQMKEQYTQLQKINLEIDNTNLSMGNLRTPTNTIKEYIDLKNRLPQLVNKKRKEAERQIQKIQDNYKSVEQDRKMVEKLLNKQKESMDIQTQIDKTNRYLNSGIGNVLNILKNHGFVTISGESVTLLLKGEIASQIKETHSLVFTNIIEDKTLDTMTAEQLVSLFSCFTNINVKDDKKEINLNGLEDQSLKKIVEKTTEMYRDFQDEEVKHNINTGIDYSHHFDLLGYINEWCLCEDVNECKIILQRMDQEKEIFLGEFVKAILKINNISCEMEKIAEMTGNISLLSKLKEIPKMTMKFVVTNQSLYV
jgi:superfamily II RNA helicase